MKRIAFICALVLLAAAVATTAFAGAAERRAGIALRNEQAGAAADSAPRSHLEGFVCDVSPRPKARSISVRAVMRPVPTTKKMEMRIELLSKSATPGSAYTEQAGSGLDTWLSPTDPTLGQNPHDVWIVPDVVRNLPFPFYYRYRVTFRWTQSGGHVVTKTRATGDCYQPAFNPDLLVSSIAIQPVPDKPMRDQYVATIEDDGLAPAVGPIPVAFTPTATANGGTPTTITKNIARVGVGPAHEVTVTFTGPACTAATAPTVVVDPAHTILETSYTNNSLTVDPSCPALTSAPVTTP